MSKNTFLLTLLALPLMLCLTSCSDSEDDSTPSMEAMELPDNTPPTEDQMKIKVNVPIAAAVPQEFEENSTGAALVKRLPQTTANIAPNTRLVVLPGSDFSMAGPTVTTYNFQDAIRVYYNGGYIALMQPTNEQVALFSLSLLVGVVALEQAAYQQMFDIDEAVAARAAQSSPMVRRLKTRAQNLQAAATRAGSDDLSAPFAEVIIFGPTDYFMQQPLLGESTAYVHSADGDGNETAPKTMTTKTERTPFVIGQLADAAAEWLNRVEKEQVANARRSTTRASGSSAINEMMDANETFTYSGAIVANNQYNLSCSYNRVNMTIRSWGVHNMELNKDYYYVKQSVTLKMGEEGGRQFFFPTDAENSWWNASDYGNYNCWYGSWLSQYVTTLDLDGSGDIVLEEALPSTDNLTQSKSISIGSSFSKTITNGISWGFSGGVASGAPTGGINIGGSYSEGTTTGTSFSMGMSTTSKDLGVTKNTTDTKVMWTYKATMPQYYERLENNQRYFCHQTPADILVNDCDVTNEICWSVGNPSGQYTVNISSTPQTAALLFKMVAEKGYKNAPHTYEYTTAETADYSHTLLEPNRAMQTWRMYLTVDEWMQSPVTGALGQMETNFRNQFPDLYANVFTIADKTATSLNTISYIINYSKQMFNKYYDVLQARALDLGIKKFSVHWRCDDINIGDRTPFTVEAGNMAQTVWCKDISTLYFISSPNRLSAGDRWDGKTVTAAWNGDDVTNLSPSANPKWYDYSANYVTRIVFDPSFATVRPKNCQYWFAGCWNLTTIEGIEYLNTSEVTSMNGMFGNCEKLTTINVDGFDMSKVTDVRQMFYGCLSLITIYCNQTWNFSIINSAGMFYNCKKLKGAVAYKENYVDARYANPDTGYFTKRQ